MISDGVRLATVQYHFVDRDTLQYFKYRKLLAHLMRVQRIR